MSVHRVAIEPASPLELGGDDLQEALADPDRRQQSIALCEQLTRRRARNFYYGIRLTPRAKRPGMYALYAWTRCVDDLADGALDDPEGSYNATRQLHAFRDLTQAAVLQDFTNVQHSLRTLNADVCHPFIWPALADAIRRYGIPESSLLDMIDGQLDDLVTRERETFDDLYTYCNQVASSVGRMCLAIWGYDERTDALQLAEWRGVALQLTNILRDYREDYERGRVYLPREDFREFDLTPQALYETRDAGRCRAFLAAQVVRARDYFEKCASLETCLTPDCVPTSLGIFLIYRKLFDRIAADPMIVLRNERVALSRIEKIKTAMQAIRARPRTSTAHPSGTTSANGRSGR